MSEPVDWYAEIEKQIVQNNTDYKRLQAENERLKEDSVDNYNRLQQILLLLDLPEEASIGAVRDAVACIKRKDPFWVMESTHGWKVIMAWEPPVGGRENGNWTMARDGLSRKKATELAERLRNAMYPRGGEG